MAELYLDWGDRLYRQARNDVSEFAKAKKKYELVMRLNNTVNQNSPLDKSGKFATMRNRVNAVIKAVFVDKKRTAENPRIVIALMRTRMQLTKIADNLNYIGLGGAEGVHGTLRNIGLSQFRTKSGAIVNQAYSADVMPLSEYNVRQDAIVFQLDTKELRLFENNGVATMWQIDLPLATNTFDLRQILDIQLVVSYDGFFDAGLEQQILANLPAGGSASRGISLRMYAPDEWFFLRNRGSAELQITAGLFPANHTNHWCQPSQRVL